MYLNIKILNCTFFVILCTQGEICSETWVDFDFSCSSALFCLVWWECCRSGGSAGQDGGAQNQSQPHPGLKAYESPCTYDIFLCRRRERRPRRTAVVRPNPLPRPNHPRSAVWPPDGGWTTLRRRARSGWWARWRPSRPSQTPSTTSTTYREFSCERKRWLRFFRMLGRGQLMYLASPALLQNFTKSLGNRTDRRSQVRHCLDFCLSDL